MLGITIGDIEANKLDSGDGVENLLQQAEILLAHPRAHHHVSQTLGVILKGQKREDLLPEDFSFIIPDSRNVR